MIHNQYNVQCTYVLVICVCVLTIWWYDERTHKEDGNKSEEQERVNLCGSLFEYSWPLPLNILSKSLFNDPKLYYRFLVDSHDNSIRTRNEWFTLISLRDFAFCCTVKLFHFMFFIFELSQCVCVCLSDLRHLFEWYLFCFSLLTTLTSSMTQQLLFDYAI